MRHMIAVGVLLTACSSWSSRTPVRGPDGQDDWWQIHCHRDDPGCMRQALLACPGGYEVKDRDRRKYMLIKCTGRSGPRATVRDD